MTGMNPDQKELMLAAIGVVAVVSVSAGAHAKYDHESTKKRLLEKTVSVRKFMEKLKDDYESVFYMGSLCDYWKSLITLDRLQINEHVAFIKYFKKERHLYCLPEISPAGSRSVSRTVSLTPNNVSIDEEEEEETE